MLTGWKIFRLTFQLTRSRGAWRNYEYQTYVPLLNFNSHAHVERDCSLMLSGMSLAISTHTLTWSVTDYLKFLWNFLQISTHTLTWSVTTLYFYFLTFKQFQLTRSRGAWQPVTKRGFTSVYFNSHAHVERDGGVFVWWTNFMHFNSHAHVERDL